MKNNAYLLLVLFLIVPVFAQAQTNITKKEVREIMQLVVDLPELQQFYHVDSDTSRSPLIIQEYSAVTANNLRGLQKFGRPIQVFSEEFIRGKNLTAFLTISDFKVIGDAGRIQLHYAIEGITVSVKLYREDGTWKITNSHIFEN